ncbi:transposase [Phaeobacter inhibens]|nr:transposase [Phaeobacter inhibens]
MVRPGDDLGATNERQASSPAAFQRFSVSAIQTCLTLKVLFGMPLRQTTGFVQSLLRLVGLDIARLQHPVPSRCPADDLHSKSAERGQKMLNVSLPYQGGTGPLNLLIPSRDITA